MPKKTKKKKAAKRGKGLRLLLRAAHDDITHGQCVKAITSLVEAAKKTPSRGKKKAELEHATAEFARSCIRGGGGFSVPAEMRGQPSIRRTPQMPKQTLPEKMRLPAGVTPGMDQHFLSLIHI